jgi:TRAP-type C4-dicarboxylate transport system substrate-binding protein
MMRLHVVFAGALALLLTSTGSVQAEEITCRIATIAPDNTPWASLLSDYEKAVEEASDGRINVKISLGGAMGDENATVRMAARGRIQAIGVSTGAVATLVPELSGVEIPFMFRSAKEADYVLDKMLLEPMEKLFREKDLVLGFWSENGFRHYGANFKIDEPGDLKGKKMRSQENFVHLGMWDALNASPQAIPATEVVTALKTGAVDGFDNSLLFTIAASWYGEISDLTLSAHIYQPAVIAFSKDWFDGLDEDLQKILIDEGRKIVRSGRERIRKINSELVDIIKSVGVNVHKLKKKERKAFEEATAGVRETYRNKGASYAKILTLIEKGVAKFR